MHFLEEPEFGFEKSAWHFCSFTLFLFFSAQLKWTMQLLQTKWRVHQKTAVWENISSEYITKWSHSFDCTTLCAPVSTFKATFSAKTKPINTHGSSVWRHDHMIKVIVFVCSKSYACKMTFKGCPWYQPILAPFSIVLPDFSQQRHTIKLPSRIHNPIISQQVTTNQWCIRICFRVNASYSAVLWLQSGMLWEHL